MGVPRGDLLAGGRAEDGRVDVVPRGDRVHVGDARVAVGVRVEDEGGDQGAGEGEGGGEAGGAAAYDEGLGGEGGGGHRGLGGAGRRGDSGV